ncbi:XrtA/PEP-CTERM system TPR-repeat protein PrsT [Roseateles sp. DC23W]|uniref:XrtA/PEP-CTERM system TPR-repeat protein PrsT n=1 Tax=Pelomonas dachongensis TaxID=3299029 RepID=A0ABW7EHP4_9BURK
MKTRHLALILCAALAACSQKSEQDLLASAQARLEQKDSAGAVIELKNVLQQNADSVQGRAMLGRALLESGDLAGAEIELRRALELGAPRDETMVLLAEALLTSGQSRKVIGEFATESLSDPQAMSRLQQHLALAYLQQGNVPEAKVAASRALQLTPQAEGAVIASARTRLAGGLVDEALTALNELLARDPKAVKALQLKAEVLLARGRAEEAEPLLTQVLALDPASFEARSLLLRMALGRQQVDEAAKLVQGMPAAEAKKPRGRFMQAQLALAQGDAAKARELALPLLKVLPQYLPLLRLASGAHQQLGELADAENLLNQAVKLAPEDPGLRRQYAGLQLQRRQPGKTLETLRPVLESGKADAETLLMAGKAQLMQGNFEGADQAFGAAAKLRPDDSKTQAALALSAIARDTVTPGGAARAKADAALGQLRELAAKDSAGNSYDLMLVNVLMRRQDLAGALAAIDKLAPKMKDSPVPDGLRGRVQLQRKDNAAAQASFDAALKQDAGYLPAVLGLVALDMQAKQTDAAVKRLEAYIAAQKHAPQARLALAELLVQTRAPAARVTEVLSAAVREEPSEAGLRVALIDHLLRTGDIKAAAQAAQEASAALPQNPDLLERLARTQLATDDRAQAAKTYAQLNVLSPTRAHGWLGMAQLRFMDKDYAGAEREVKRALEADPGSVAAQRLLIQLAARQGRTDEALAALHERQKKNPQEAYALIAEADIEAGRQKFDAAIAALRKATTLRDPADAPVRLFSLLLVKKREDALAFEKQWLAAHPQDQGFAAATADLVLARGDFDGALERYEALLKRNPDAVPLINNVAWLRSKTGKPGARELAERGLKLNGDDAALRDTYATVLANEKAFDKALSVQRQLIGDHPDQPSFKVNLAQILIQSGDKTAAKAELQDLAKLGSKLPQQKQVEALLKTL